MEIKKKNQKLVVSRGVKENREKMKLKKILKLIKLSLLVLLLVQIVVLEIHFHMILFSLNGVKIILVPCGFLKKDPVSS